MVFQGLAAKSGRVRRGEVKGIVPLCRCRFGLWG